MKKLTVDLKDIGNVEVNVPEGCTVKLDGSNICVVKEEVLTWEEIVEDISNTGFEILHLLGLRRVSVDNKYVWVNSSQSKKIHAIAQLMVIADYYNKGRKDEVNVAVIPMWSNRIIEHNGECHDGVTHIYKGYWEHPYWFASLDIMRKAYENNKEIFETALKP